MKIKCCNRCGYKLDYTSFKFWWCRNCGKLVENQDEEEINKSQEEEPTYIR